MKKKDLTQTRTLVETKTSDFSNEFLDKAEKFQPSLVFLQGNKIGQTYFIEEGKNIIGRGKSCNLILNQRYVSSEHSIIIRKGKTVEINDLKSSNGTLVNRQKLSSLVKLKEGDLIKIGQYVMRYVEKQLESDFAAELRKKGITDELTGTFNKAYIMNALESSINIAMSGYPLSLIVLDLDHFKKVNDVYGHLAGDYVLSEACNVLREKVLREEDLLGRFGGEEFMVILPELDLSQAKNLAERIRTALQVHNFNYQGKNIQVTASIGVCEWTPEIENNKQFLQKADELVYRAKSEGRNRVCS